MAIIGLTGMQYQLDSKKLSDGGEGTIYRILGQSSKMVAKIYNDGLATRELEDKLKYMVRRQPSSSVLNQVAWPLDVIYDSNKYFLGFVMPLLSINAELGEIYKYPSKIDISAYQKLLIARNICVVIAEVHKAGYVFGDFNPRNIGVDKDNCTVAFLDTDSYHIIDRTQSIEYRCKVGCDGYIAPELLKNCDDFKACNPKIKDVYAKVMLPSFTKETDNFALAIHIFKLMMNGYTPFGGIAERASASQASPGLGNDAIRRNNYCFKPGLKPQAAAVPQLESFPQEIAELFTRSFMVLRKIDPMQRPSANECRTTLDKYINDKDFVTCVNNHLHQYNSKNGFCPYCKADLDYTESLTPNKQVVYTPSSAPPVLVPTSSSRMSRAYGKTARDSWWQRRSTGVKTTIVVALLGAVVLGFGLINGVFSNFFISGDAQSPTQQPSEYYNQTPDPVINDELVPQATAPLTRSVTELQGAVAVGGENYSLYIDEHGDLWAWGNNDSAQLGDGTTENRIEPVQVMDSVMSVSAGSKSAMAIKTDGSLWAWGYNSFGELGDGTTETRPIPVEILDSVISVSANGTALKTDGTLWTWGLHGASMAEQSIGWVGGTTSPEQILDSVISFSASGSHIMAIKTDNSLWIWGANWSGEIGDGTKNANFTPVKIMDSVTSVSAGRDHSMAIKSDGSLWAWGANDEGQLGDGTTETRLMPVKIMDSVVNVYAGDRRTLFVKEDGNLWTCGTNWSGQLGDGTSENQLTPIKILDSVAFASSSYMNAIAIKTDGSLWAWGDNSSAQVGDGTFINRRVPTLISVGQYNPMYAAYYEIIKEAIEMYGVIDSEEPALDEMDRKVVYAELIDINNDGSQELLYARYLGGGAEGIEAYVYGYSNGKVELYGTFTEMMGNIGYWGFNIVTGNNGVKYLHSYSNEAYKRFNSYDEVVGYDIIDSDTYETLENGKWITAITLNCFTGYEDESIVEEEWSINNTTVSELEYNTALDTVIGIIEVREIQASVNSVNTVLTELKAKSK